MFKQFESSNKKTVNIVTIFEDLSNELLFDIFEYLDAYQLYLTFGQLNGRFNLLLATSRVHFDLDPIPLNEFPSFTLSLNFNHILSFTSRNLEKTRSWLFDNNEVLQQFSKIRALTLFDVTYGIINRLHERLPSLKSTLIYANIAIAVVAGFLNKISDKNNTAMMALRCDEVLSHSRIHGHVLEIGAGTGINLACLHNNTRIIDYIGMEPNTHMYSYIQTAIKRWNVPFEVRLSSNSATAMTDVESNSIDTIIMIFVLCSVPDPLSKELLIEAHRVLKSGGELHLLEHIAADSNMKPMMYAFQRFIEPAWTIIGDGCRFKPTTNYLDQMKTIYTKVSYQKIEIPIPIIVARDGIKGVLTK
ncbi:unnamed protein product [Rotaria sordida]|uniref:Methyltransferase type 11 domain-containing protein n=1 Tax=Rotaria sordida TaxID=392033 RepID=A0A814FPC6_9BILA|nr:unnamed protein product [Rotaria sordida]